eukprot:6175905-Pleurochrysis_carterae.AAC.1
MRAATPTAPVKARVDLAPPLRPSVPETHGLPSCACQICPDCAYLVIMQVCIAAHGQPFAHKQAFPIALNTIHPLSNRLQSLAVSDE